MKELLVYISIICIFLIGLSLYIYIQSKNNNENDIQVLINKIRKSCFVSQEVMMKKMEEIPYIQRKNQEIEKMIDITESEYTLDSIYKYRKIVLICTFAAFILVLIFVGFIPSILILAIGGLCSYVPDFRLKQDLSMKYQIFDNTLPDYISRVSLAMNAGMNLSQAMIIATRALDGDIKKEFVRFLADTERNQDDIAKPYINLRQRFPTKSCERFCSVVITGIKNGNKMSEILEKETNYINDETLIKMEEQGKKNEIVSTAISTGFIFIPITALLIAPIMMTSV